MHMSPSSRRELFLIVAALSVIVACTNDASTDDACSTFEAAKSLDGKTATFRDERSPWVVTADLDGKVTVHDTKKSTSCSTTVDSVVSVYLGAGAVIYFRSLEIASDNLFAIDGRSCADAGEPVRLDPTSAEKSNTLMRAVGICTSR